MPTQKCSNCGEDNAQTLKVCGLCGAVLPWASEQRTNGNSAQGKAGQKPPVPQPSSQRPPSHTLPDQNGWALLLNTLPKYRGTETPTIGLGNIELPLSPFAALVGIFLFAISPFPPLINFFVMSGGLFSILPLFGCFNLAAAVVAGVALMQESLRWCYLSFFLGASSLFFFGLKMAQFPIETVNPWQMLQWGIVPIVLAPLFCFVAAFFVGVPEEQETEAANPFGHEDGLIFQKRIYLRLKELSKTHVFQEAIRADGEGVKAQLHQLRAANCWADVAPETRQLLESAEKELDSAWEL